MTIEHFHQGMNTHSDSSDLFEAMRSIRDSGSDSTTGLFGIEDDTGMADWNPWH